MAEYFCKEDIVEYLEYLNNELPLITERDWDRAKGYDEVIEEVKKFQTADVQPVKWIPVSEQLPPIGDNVIVFAYNRMIKIWALVKLSSFSADVYWESDDDYEHDVSVVTHWMPLPEPPKDGKT